MEVIGIGALPNTHIW